MPNYIVTSPTGQKFQITAPDGATQEQILAYAQQQFSKTTPEQTAVANQSPSFAKQLASAAVRPIAKGIAALPLMAMDAGVSARNLLTGKLDFSNSWLGQAKPDAATLPSDTFNQALDHYTLPPSGAGKVAEFVSSALVGSRIPSPQAAQQAPANFVKPAENLVRQATLQNSQNAGYVVPPATTNPSLLTNILESAGGKIATAQDAAIKNQDITNSLARRALGLPNDAQLTQQSLAALRANAGNAYDILRGAGKVTTDSQFMDDLAKVASKFTGTEKDFPELAQSEITDVVKAVGKKEFDSGSAVDLLSILRDRANRAYGAGDKALGGAYKSISNAIENVIERNLSTQGESGADLLKGFRDARQLIAKTYSVEKAFNPSTGNVSAQKLATQLTNGKPLSGSLKTAAQFGQAFPKAAREVLDSGSVRNTDVILGAGSAALSGEPWYLLYPFGRQMIRSGLLSDVGQRLATPSHFQVPSGLMMGTIPPEEQLRQSLFGQ